MLVRAREARPTCDRSSGPLLRPILALLDRYRRRWQRSKGAKPRVFTGRLERNAAYRSDAPNGSVFAPDMRRDLWEK